jgi:hypothetical protein
LPAIRLGPVGQLAAGFAFALDQPLSFDDDPFDHRALLHSLRRVNRLPCQTGHGLNRGTGSRVGR